MVTIVVLLLSVEGIVPTAIAASAHLTRSEHAPPTSLAPCSLSVPATLYTTLVGVVGLSL